jgi:hypothetical protein
VARRSTAGCGLLLLWWGAACDDQGSVALRFDLPERSELRPAGAETVTLVARVGDGAPRATTAQIGDGSAIDLGALPVDEQVWLSVELRTADEKLVGFGRAAEALAVRASERTEATIPVRRPFVYVAGAGAGLVSFDTTLASTASYQGQVSTAETAAVIADLAGTALATISTSGALAYVSTSTHEAGDLPAANLPAAPLDAVATPDGAYLLVGHGAGGAVSVVTVATGEVASVELPGPADRIAITRGGDGAWWGVALIGRALVDRGCAASQLAHFPLANLETPIVTATGVGLADLAGDPRAGVVYVADRCNDRVLRFDPVEGTLDTAAPVLALPAPTALAAGDGRLWAIGHALLPTTSPNVPDGIIDAWLVLGSWDGLTARVEPLPPVIERVVARRIDYPDQAVTQELHANAVVADDLVILPGGQLALLTSVELRGDALVYGLFGIVVPQLDVTTREYWLLDAATRVLTQRVRTRCTIVHGRCDTDLGLCEWDCLPDIAPPLVAEFTPTGIAGLFGAR